MHFTRVPSSRNRAKTINVQCARCLEHSCVWRWRTWRGQVVACSRHNVRRRTPVLLIGHSLPTSWSRWVHTHARWIQVLKKGHWNGLTLDLEKKTAGSTTSWCTDVTGRAQGVGVIRERSLCYSRRCCRADSEDVTATVQLLTMTGPAPLRFSLEEKSGGGDERRRGGGCWWLGYSFCRQVVTNKLKLLLSPHSLLCLRG